MSKTLLTLLLLTTTSANTNTVSITHGAHSTNYCSGLNVVKSNDDAQYNTNCGDEYVTDFYTQKRRLKRQLAEETVSDESGEREADDHSLDHYFDCEGVAGRSGLNYDKRRDDGKINLKRNKMAFVPRHRRRADSSASYDNDGMSASLNNNKEHARVASSVRGGSISQEVAARRQGDHNNNYRGRRRNGRDTSGRASDGQCLLRRHPRNVHRSASAATTSFDRRHKHRNSHSHLERHINDYSNEHYSDVDEMYSDNAELTNDNNNKQSSSSHKNLLRLPCQLRLNTHQSHNHNNNIDEQTRTPITAYIDTGAQVTVISATAARKAGIYHLIDRRYAGRATGVGSCRVLGRVPAGCVDFLLGRSNDDDGEYDKYDQEEEEAVIQMAGPALTVLEGTVTEGVDMLLGLDVLQDWEATIQLGGSRGRSSIKVRKRGLVDPVVLPCVIGNENDVGGRGERRRNDGINTLSHGGHGQRRRRMKQPDLQTVSDQAQYYANQSQPRDVLDDNVEEDDYDDDDDDSFSPFSSDIESDLDLLDQSEFTHEFPHDGSRRQVKQYSEEIVHDIERENELLGVHRSRGYIDESKSNFMEDDSSDEECDDEEREAFDMSGL